MLAEERIEAILARLKTVGRVLVADLAQELAVSDETVRRDLQRLERAGLLRRSHGGAVPVALRQAQELPHSARAVLNLAAKRRIASQAALQVSDGQAVMLDNSSTVLEVVPCLASRRGLTLVSNAAGLLSHPDTAPHALLSVGGEWHRESLSFEGPLAVEGIRRFQADVALISVKSLSLTLGLMVAGAEDAELKRAFIDSAARVVLLADGDKFSAPGLISAAPLSRIDLLITDRTPGDDWRRVLDKAGVDLRIVP